MKFFVFCQGLNLKWYRFLTNENRRETLNQLAFSSVDSWNEEPRLLPSSKIVNLFLSARRVVGVC